MPWLSLRWRTASGSSVPAAAEEPSRLRPKRAPSSSAQSISFSVTAGVSPLCAAQDLDRGAARPRQPSSQPPCGTASMCEPTTTILSRLAGDRRPQVPGDVALDGRVGLGELAEQPLARAAPVLAPREPARPVGPTGQLRQLVQVLERTLPVEVGHGAGRLGATRGARAGFFASHDSLGAHHRGLALPFSACSSRAAARGRSHVRQGGAASAATTGPAPGDLRGPGARLPQGAEDADALHAAGLHAGRADAGARSSAAGFGEWITAPVERRASTPTTRPSRTCSRPRATARSWTSAGGRAAAGRSAPSGRSRRSASSPTCGRTWSCATSRIEDGGYVGVVFNRGREAAGPFDVDFLRRRRAGRHRRGRRAGAADAGHGDVACAGAAALRGGRRRSRRSPTRARRSTRPTRRTTPSASSAERLVCPPTLERAMKTEIHPEYARPTFAAPAGTSS